MEQVIRGQNNYVRVIDVLFSLEGRIRHCYFHPESKRLERFKNEMKRHIISSDEKSINKRSGVRIN